MKRTALAARILTATAAQPAAAAPAIQPGYWESTNRLLSPIRQSSTEKRCITPAEVDKFMAGPSNRHYACTYPTKVISGGQIRLKGTCVSKKGRKVAVQGSGAYTSTEARRIGDTCPPPPAPAPTQAADGK